MIAAITPRELALAGTGVKLGWTITAHPDNILTETVVFSDGIAGEEFKGVLHRKEL